MIEQTVVLERPPIFDEAQAMFGPRVDRAIFSWREKIYNPAGIYIPPELLAHEAVHGERSRCGGAPISSSRASGCRRRYPRISPSTGS